VLFERTAEILGMTNSPAVLRRLISSYEGALALALALSFAVLAFAAPRFFLPANLASLVRNSSVLLIMSMGMLVVILSGGIDISVGSLLAAASVVLGRMAVQRESAVVAILLAVAVGIGGGAINAFFIAAFDLPPIIVTLATLGMFRGLLLQFTGGEWVTTLPPWLLAVGHTFAGGIDATTIIAIAIACGTWAFLRFTTAGRQIYRFGGSPEAATRRGISRNRVIYLVYISMGLLTAIAAILFAAQLGSVQGNAAVGYELTVIAAVVLGGASVAGGRGTVIGTVLGVLLLATIQAAVIMLRVPAFWQGVVTGLMVLIGVSAGALQGRRRAPGLSTAMAPSAS
jgi:ribose/xylose/arabinose/galactoside ABC-type transport system permease subunit